MAAKRDAAFEKAGDARTKADELRLKVEPELDHVIAEGDDHAGRISRAFKASQEAWNADDRAGAAAFSAEGKAERALCEQINARADRLRQRLKDAQEEIRRRDVKVVEHKQAIAELRAQLDELREAEHIDYAQIVDRAGSIDDAIADLEDVWADAYRVVNPDAKLYTIELESVTYLFDHVESDDDGDSIAELRASRVVAAWGVSSTPSAPRDTSRMRGHPRPGRQDDDRGHLVALASGGGYDINLIPQDARLNRGRTPEGKRFRAMERFCAANPGTPFFIRPVYADDSDRPAEIEFGILKAEGPDIARFRN